MVKILETAQGTVIEIYLKPNSREFRIEIEDNEFVVRSRETAEKGKVNRELTKELARLFKRRVEIISGLTSRQKRILIKNSTIKEVNQILSHLTEKRM